MKKNIYLLIILVLVLLLSIFCYLLFIAYPQKYDDFKDLVSLKENALSNSIPINEFDLVVYEDDTYAGILNFEHFYSVSIEEEELPVLKVTEEETFEGYFLNLYLNDKNIDKLSLTDYYLSEEEYEEYDNEYKDENIKNKIKINDPFGMANFTVYNIENEGFAIAYLYSSDTEGEFGVYKLNFYSYDGDKIGQSYIVADDSDYSYSNFSNFEFNGVSFEYWDLDCDKNKGIRRSLQLKDGNVIEKIIDKDSNIYKIAKDESSECSTSFICE